MRWGVIVVVCAVTGCKALMTPVDYEPAPKSSAAKGCTSNSDCANGDVCVDGGRCAKPVSDSGRSCEFDSDCTPGLSCRKQYASVKGVCAGG